MKAEQTLLDIRDALREFDFSAAQTVLEKHCNEYLEWAVKNFSVPYEGFSLSFFNNALPRVWVNGEEIAVKDFYELFNKEKGNQ